MLRRERALGFRSGVLAKGRCVVTGDVADEAHHVIPKGKLKKIASALDDTALDELLYDVRNGVPLTERAHRRHTLAVERVPFEALPPEVHEFAAELELEWYIERFYPKRAHALDAAEAAGLAVQQGGSS